MIQTCISAATQGTPITQLQTLDQLLDSSKVANKAQKGLITINRSIVDLQLSKLSTRALLSLGTFVCVASIVAHFVLYAVGSALQMLSSLPRFWNESLKNGFRPLFFGTVNFIASPAYAILATFGSIALQFKTIAQVGTTSNVAPLNTQGHKQAI